MATTFDQALKLCYLGYPVRRETWVADKSISIQKGSIDPSVTTDLVAGAPRSMFDTASGETVMPKTILTGTDDAWTPAMEDMVAGDWVALDQTLPEDPTLVFWPAA